MSKQTQKSHLGQLLFIKGFLRLIRTYWAEVEKVDIFATIRTYWVEVLKDPQFAEISYILGKCCLHLNRPKKVMWGNFCLLMAL